MLTKLTSLSLALLIAFLLPSCVALDSGGYGYTSYSRSYGSVYDDDCYYDSSPSYSYSRPWFGGSSHYYSDHNHSSGHSSHSSSRSKPQEKIRLVRGDDGNHSSRPSGYHTPEWYKNRGYNLHRYTYKDEDGDVKHNAHSSKKKH